MATSKTGKTGAAKTAEKDSAAASSQLQPRRQGSLSTTQQANSTSHRQRLSFVVTNSNSPRGSVFVQQQSLPRLGALDAIGKQDVGESSLLMPALQHTSATVLPHFVAQKSIPRQSSLLSHRPSVHSAGTESSGDFSLFAEGCSLSRVNSSIPEPWPGMLSSSVRLNHRPAPIVFHAQPLAERLAPATQTLCTLLAHDGAERFACSKGLSSSTTSSSVPAL